MWLSRALRDDVENADVYVGVGGVRVCVSEIHIDPFCLFLLIQKANSTLFFSILGSGSISQMCILIVWDRSSATELYGYK